MAQSDSLTRKQRRAIACLLMARTVADAATQAKVSSRTLYRWLLNPNFRQALTGLETETIDEAGRRLLAGQGLALDTLNTLMTNAQKENDKRLAAAAWLDFCLRWRELRNVEERLLALEEAVMYGKKHG